MNEKIRLNDGRLMPQLGFGVWQVTPAQTKMVVETALQAGFTLIDTAAGYENEKEVGEALRESPTPREEVFVTTKLRNSEHGYDQALKSFDVSMNELGLDYLDLYLIHWPVPSKNLFVETWRALVRLRQEGRVRSIGVSNFTPQHLQRIIDETGIVPALNQVELHPRFSQRELRQFEEPLGIVTQSWSPLGRGHLPEIPAIREIAAKHGKSWAQIVLRWHLDSGLAVVTRSSNPARIQENFGATSFCLDAEDMARMNTLDRADGRVARHPDNVAD